MFSSRVKVYFYDADPAGIIFYANLFKYAHVAFEDFLRSLDTENDFLVGNEYTLPVLHTEADYMKTIAAGEELRIDGYVSQLRNSSFEVSYKLYKDENQLAAIAKMVHVCVATEKFVKAELPKDFYDVLKANLISE
jgi:1,4-dihydroxy-2-naphthoyl-CoA hydrolase